MSWFKNLIGFAQGGNLYSAKKWGIRGLDKYIIDAGDTLGQSFGGSINDWTGTTDQMDQQYQHNKDLQKLAQDFNAAEAEKQRQFSANESAKQRAWEAEQSSTAVQRRAADLKAAGMNPVLAAGSSADTGAGAAASGSAATSQGGSTGTGAGHDPIAMVGQIIGMMNSSKQTKGMVENMNADSELKQAEAYKTWITSDPEAKKLEKEYDALIQQIKESQTRQELTEAQKGLAEWESRHPVASKILGGAAGAASGIASAAIMGRAMQMGQKARINNAKQPKVQAGTIYTSSPIKNQEFPQYW